LPDLFKHLKLQKKNCKKYIKDTLNRQAKNNFGQEFKIMRRKAEDGKRGSRLILKKYDAVHIRE